MINAWKLIKLLRPKMQSFGLHPNMGVSLLYGLALENFLGQKKHKKKKRRASCFQAELEWAASRFVGDGKLTPWGLSLALAHFGGT